MNKNRNDMRPSVASVRPESLQDNDCRPYNLPARSTLYFLKPIGVGTGTVESVTSYVVRIAWQHRISLTCLLEQVIGPRTDKTFIINGGARILSAAFRGYHRSINGTGETAASWVGYLQALTLRTDLSHLTLRTFREVLAQKELLRSYKAWCPQCYDNQLQTLGTFYDPLLWIIDAVKVCHLHECPLVYVCPTCNRKLCHLSRRYRLGHCHRCQTSLTVLKSRQRKLSANKNTWQMWVANNVADLLASGSDNRMVPARETLRATAQTILDYCFKGNQTEFARAVNKHKTTVWGWCQSDTRIGLNDVLNICYCLNIKPSAFLSGVLIRNPQLKTVTLRSSFVKRTGRVERRVFDPTKTEKRLQRQLGAQESPSMQQVAIRLDLNKRFLYKHFPGLCRSIAAKHSAQHLNTLH